MTITRAELDTVCAGFPGTRLSVPPELVSWKVGEKMFACFGDFDDTGGVSVKTRDIETASILIDSGAAERAPYFHRSWVRFAYDRADRSEVIFRLGQSYDIVRASLKKAIRDTLPPRQTEGTV